MIPPALILGLAIHAGFALLQLLAGEAGAHVFEGIWDLLGWGFQSAGSILTAVGAFQLARRAPEPARFGSRRPASRCSCSRSRDSRGRASATGCARASSGPPASTSR